MAKASTTLNASPVDLQEFSAPPKGSVRDLPEESSADPGISTFAQVAGAFEQSTFGVGSPPPLRPEMVSPQTTQPNWPQLNSLNSKTRLCNQLAILRPACAKVATLMLRRLRSTIRLPVHGVRPTQVAPQHSVQQATANAAAAAVVASTYTLEPIRTVGWGGPPPAQPSGHQRPHNPHTST